MNKLVERNLDSIQASFLDEIPNLKFTMNNDGTVSLRVEMMTLKSENDFPKFNKSFSRLCKSLLSYDGGTLDADGAHKLYLTVNEYNGVILNKICRRHCNTERFKELIDLFQDAMENLRRLERILRAKKNAKNMP